MTKDLHELTVRELISGLKARTFNSVELTEHFLERIEQHNSTLNAYISVHKSTALEAAKRADEHLNKQPELQLLGIPVTLKDIYCYEGQLTTCGSKMLEKFIAPYDATVTSNLKQQHAPILGKANMDEFAMGSTTRTSYFKPTLNPWDKQAVPGGSSGGSAAAVAARLTPLAIGTDTGGSIRQPAACCGITGLKPTYGVVSRWGQVAFASSLDQGGPMARSAEDCAFLLDAISGFDIKDSTSINQTKTNTANCIDEPLDSCVVGIPYDLFEQELDKESQSKLEAAIQTLHKLNVKTKPINLKSVSLAIATYYVIASAEASSNLSRYDGVRYGYRCKDPIDLMDLYKRTRSEGFGEEVKRRLMVGTFVLSSGYYDAYYLQAQKIRRIITEEFKSIFKEVQFVLTPTKPGVAFDLATTQSPVSTYMEDIFTVPANLGGFPAISMPIGFNQQNRPYGMQLIANHLQESALLKMTHQYQRLTDHHLKTPTL